MGFIEQRNEILGICKDLLDKKEVELILGYTTGEPDDSAIPMFIRDEKQLESLKWDEFCATNLAQYLRNKKGKTAIIAKPCDVRAVVMYLAEKQINRDDVHIIGVECGSMKLADGTSAPGCAECRVKTPPMYDNLVKFEGDIVSEGEHASEDGNKKASVEENLARFQEEMQKCILCFSCRQICYGCYCKTCFIDKTTPNWLGTNMDIGQKMVFHLGRAMHLAGRCVECGECERACPSGVKIRYLIKELTEQNKMLYDYEAGLNLDDNPAMASYALDDREVGFLGGEDDES